MSPAMHTVCSIAYHISFIIMAAESQNEMNAVSDQPLAKINLINKYKSIVSFLNQLPLLNLGTYCKPILCDKSSRKRRVEKAI
jgi:hypothetical protein